MRIIMFLPLYAVFLAIGCLPAKYTPPEEYTLGIDLDNISEEVINSKSCLQVYDITTHCCIIESDSSGRAIVSNTSLVFQVDNQGEHYNVVVDMSLAHSDMLDIPVDMAEATRFKAACILLRHWVKGTTSRAIVLEPGQSIDGTLVSKLKIRTPDGDEVVIATASSLSLVEAVSRSKKATPPLKCYEDK